MFSYAQQKHGSLVLNREVFGENTATVLIGWFCPFSLIAPDELKKVAQKIYGALKKHGTAYIQQWYFPSEARQGYAVMNVYDGDDCKIVRAGVPRCQNNQAHFVFEWMVAEPNRQVRREVTSEVRHLHTKADIVAAFPHGACRLLEKNGLRFWRIQNLDGV